MSVTAKRRLERLARHRGATHRAVLEALLTEAERSATADLSTKDSRVYFA